MSRSRPFNLETLADGEANRARVDADHLLLVVERGGDTHQADFVADVVEEQIGAPVGPFDAAAQVGVAVVALLFVVDVGGAELRSGLADIGVVGAKQAVQGIRQRPAVLDRG
jgi:hypothetical protein